MGSGSMTYGNTHVGKNDTRDSFRVPGFITPLDTVSAFLKHGAYWKYINKPPTKNNQTQGGDTLVS